MRPPHRRAPGPRRPPAPPTPRAPPWPAVRDRRCSVPPGLPLRPSCRGDPAGFGVSQLDQHGIPAQVRLEVVGGAAGDDATTVDDRDATRQAIGLLQVMRRQQDGQPVDVGEPGDLGPKLGPGLRVEARGRLVQEEDAGPVDQAHGHIQLALHAARVGSGHPARGLGQTEALEQAIHPSAKLLAADPVQQALQLQVLAPGGVRIDGDPLTNHADPAPHLLGLPEHVGPGNGRGAIIGLDERGEYLDRRRLAGAIRPEQSEDRTLLDFDTEPVECDDIRPVALDQPGRLDGRARMCWHCCCS